MYEPYHAVGILLSAVLLLVMTVAAVRLGEGRWAAPSILFFVAFFMHAFVDPLMRAERDALMSTDMLDHILEFSLASLACLTLGYGLTQGVTWVCGRRELATVGMRRLYAPSGITFASLSLVAVLCSMYAVLLLSGGLTQARGFASYEGGVFKQLSLVNTAVFALLGSLFIAIWQTKGRTRRNLIVLVSVAFVLIGLHSVLQFARRGFMTAALVLVIIYHTRLGRIGWRHVVVLGVAGILVMFFSLARSIGVGILELKMSELQGLARISVDNSELIFGALAKGLPGQAVFSRTMEFVPAVEGFRHGLTYLESAASVFTPNFLTSGYDLETPAFWFRDIYAPGRTGHGFDFSMMAEAYLNFGHLGPLIFIVVGGVVAVVSNCIRRSASSLAVLWSTIILVDLIVGLRNDSNAIIKRAIYFMVPVLLVLLVQWLYRRLVLGDRGDDEVTS